MELLRALGALAEPPDRERRRVARLLRLPPLPDAEAHTALFVLQLQPYASIYLGPEGMMGGEAAGRVAGFWRAIGAVPPAEPDHLAALLSLAAALAEAENAEGDAARRALRRRARHALLWEHLASWLIPYLERVEALGPPCYAAWGALLRDALVAEAERLGPPETLPIHLRETPPLDAGVLAGSLHELTAALLAPARSGLVLARADLARGARALGLGLRVAERRYALESMLRQDAVATLRWFAEEAARRADRYTTAPRALGPIAAFWRNRAMQTTRALGGLRRASRRAREDERREPSHA